MAVQFFCRSQPQRAIISDLNNELVELYKGIRNYPHKVWGVFEDLPAGKEAYYRIRDEEYKDKPLYYRAARTLYLNRTCFKGMWRHNPEGGFNVGYGGEERRWVITHENIIELSKRFKNATILQSDFGNILEQATNDDFIFLDPPYKPGEKEMCEAHYINGNFTFLDQRRLAAKLKSISRRKIKWLMTNSAIPKYVDFIKAIISQRYLRELGNIIGVQTSDSNEVIISNY